MSQHAKQRKTHKSLPISAAKKIHVALEKFYNLALDYTQDKILFQQSSSIISLFQYRPLIFDNKYSSHTSLSLHKC